MAVGDAAYIKKINRSSILRHIIKEGTASRADLSSLTHLTRATISAQVADLLDDGLILEQELEHVSVGRKPIALTLNNKAGFALGIDLDYGQIDLTLTDLIGQPVQTRAIKCDTHDYNSVLRLLIKEIKHFQTLSQTARHGMIGLTIGIHGLVGNDETIHYIPRLQWDHIDLKSDLRKTFDLPIFIENNANLSAFAERIYVHNETKNLLSVSLLSGIGLGMIMNDEFYKGQDGFAGEVGHMIVVPGGKPCTCGNTGCWEKYASESIFFSQLIEKSPNCELTYEQIQKWLKNDDEEVKQLFDQFIYYLSIGLNNIINIFNPDHLVIDSPLLNLDPDAIKKIKGHLTSTINQYHDLTLSKLGRKSTVLGACAFAIKQFLDVSMLSLPFSEKIKEMENSSQLR